MENDKRYMCDKCGREYSQKWHLTDHLNKKIPCDKLLNEIIEDDVFLDNKFTNKKVINSDMTSQYINDLVCIYCEKKFSTKGNLTCHIKNSCKVKKEANNKKNIFDKLKEENELLRKQLEEEKNKSSNIIVNSNNNINNNNNVDNSKNINIQNIQNIQNIYIINYDQMSKEQIDKFITKKEITECFKNKYGGFQTPTNLTKTVHFNEKYPQFHNVYIPKINEKYGMVFNDGVWKLIDKNDLVDDVYNMSKDYVEESLKEHYDLLTRSQQKALKKWLNTDDDSDSIRNTKDDIKRALHDYRKIPIEYTKEVEKNKKKQIKNKE